MHLYQTFTWCNLSYRLYSPPFIFQTVGGMYMDLHLAAFREQGTPPTPLGFEHNEHKHTVVFFSTEAQAAAITA